MNFKLINSHVAKTYIVTLLFVIYSNKTLYLMTLLLVVLFSQVIGAIKTEQWWSLNVKGKWQPTNSNLEICQFVSTVSVDNVHFRNTLLFSQVHSPPGFVFVILRMCTCKATSKGCFTITIHSSAAYTTKICTNLACLFVICQIVLNEKLNITMTVSF